MARNMQPIAKRCKALGISPAVMGYAKKETNRNPGGQMRKKKSEYGIQLNESRRSSSSTAFWRSSSTTTTRLLPLPRQDRRQPADHRGAPFGQRGVPYGLCHDSPSGPSAGESRPLHRQRHKKVNIPSYLVKAGDVIEVAESSRSSEVFKRLTGQDAPMFLLPAWMEREKNTLKGTVIRLPAREDIDVPVEEHLIVELYSK